MKWMIFPARYVIIKEKECRLQNPGGLQAAHTEEELFMNQQFCGNCGAEVEAGAVFCASCGSRIAASGGQSAGLTTGSSRKKPNMKAILTMAGGVVVVALVVVLIILLSGDGPAGEVLKNYRYKEIVGTYDGEMTIQKLKVSGDYDEIAEFTGMMSKDELSDYKNETMDCTLTLSDNALILSTTDAIFLASARINIDDLEFVKGHAEGKITDKDDSSDGTLTYDLTLHEGTKRDTKYRIYGEIQVSVTIKILKAKATFSCTLLVDCEQ